MSPLMCLAVAVFFEARGETLEGQRAVAEVILNRVEDSRYPNTVCDVVFEPKAFSFTHDGLSDKLPNSVAAERALEVAGDSLAGDTIGVTSTHYHSVHVEPYWAKHYKLDGKVGNHIFYTNETKYK